MRLKDKVALVTGASGGLGQGICEEFAREGADCIVVYHRDKAEGENTARKVQELGRRAELVQADTGNELQVKAMIGAAERAFGRLDIVVANAGIGGGSKPLLETSLADFERVIQTNLIGTYLTVRYGAELMAKRRSGKVITMSSVHGIGATHQRWFADALDELWADHPIHHSTGCGRVAGQRAPVSTASPLAAFMPAGMPY